MPVIQDTIRGAIKVTDLPDRAAFTTWADFIKSLERYLAVELPVNVSGVIFDRSQPSEDNRDKIWIRRESNGDVTGLYIFSGGKWKPFYALAPNQVTWMYGDSGNLPDSFVLINTGDVVIEPDVVVHIKNQYLPKAGGGWSYFAVRYSP